MTLKRVIEAMLFASARPLQAAEVCAVLKAAASSGEENADELAKLKEEVVAQALVDLRREFEENELGFRLRETSGGWRMASDPSCAPWVSHLFPEARPARLSPAALETLAIVAYRQPITRADIEAVRGVAVDGVLQTLLERDLIQVAGRAEIPGRPLLYESTPLFLERFGLRHLEDLPNAAELRSVPLPKAEPPPEPEAEVPPENTPALPGMVAEIAEESEEIAEEEEATEETEETEESEEVEADEEVEEAEEELDDEDDEDDLEEDEGEDEGEDDAEAEEEGEETGDEGGAEGERA